MDARITIKKKGEYLFRSGESTTSKGLVLSGTVLVIQEGLWGRRNIMARVRSRWSEGGGICRSTWFDIECECGSGGRK